MTNDYKPGDTVITVDGMLAKFISYKMDNNFATLMHLQNKETEVYHVDNFKIWRRAIY